MPPGRTTGVKKEGGKTTIGGIGGRGLAGKVGGKGMGLGLGKTGGAKRHRYVTLSLPHSTTC